MSLKDQALVTICVPAFRSSGFIEETLRSLQKQTFQQFRVRISIDGNDLETLQKCAPFLEDKRFEAVLQIERLGWVKNTNFLLDCAEGPYVMILPHDDLLHPYYLEELVEYLNKHPRCALVYTDIEAFSEDPCFHRFYFAQPSVRGGRFERMLHYLERNIDCVGFRGLMRKGVLEQAGSIEPTPFEDFAADTVWLGKIARVGELHRYPYLLYQKRYHGENTHQKWFQASPQLQMEVYQRHCQDLLNQYLKEDLDERQIERLEAAAFKRLNLICSRWRTPKQPEAKFSNTL